MQFRTKAIHAGQHPDHATGAVIPPVHLATTFVQHHAGEWREFDYSRSGNPTRQALETTLAALESGCGALAFASGMAATNCVLQTLQQGDHVLLGTDVYGGTHRLLHKIAPRHGITVSQVDTTQPDSVRGALRPQTKLLWLESPGNPLLSISDIQICAELAHAHGALLAVDNTLASPALTRPLELGADVVMHSATKFLGGHSDVLGGALIVRDAELHKQLYYTQNATGGVLAPWDAYLCSRGIKTLDLRVRAQSETALRLANYLQQHPRVRRVYYPGLATHPGHEIAARQMQGGFGALFSFELHGDLQAAKRCVELTHLFRLAVSLGAVESLIEQPASMSHASYDPAARAKYGISDSLIRVSVGLEAFEDLQADLQAAIEQATAN